MGKITDALKDTVIKIHAHFPIDEEPMIETMSLPVVIESACPGWQPAAKYPAVPCSIAAQVQEQVDSVRAGAAVIHVHPRNPEDCVSELNNTGLLVEVMEGVFAKVGDCVTIQHTWSYDPVTMLTDYIHHTQELLEAGKGNKYCQASVVLPANRIGMNGQLFTADATWAGVRWLEENKVKPAFQLYDTYAHFDLWQTAIRTGMAKWKPYLLNVNLGKHHSHTIHKDPWSYLQLIANFKMVQETIPESLIGVYPGGRNWMPILVLGLLMGASLVRVGIEDCYWMWPHKNELIRKNSDVVAMTAEMCHMLGRKVITDPVEARSMLGLTLTSTF